MLAQTFTYVLSRADLAELTSTRRCATASVGPAEGPEIVVCPLSDEEAVTLAGEAALQALASFTGGCYADEPCDDDAGAGPHALWVGGIMLAVLGLWGSRVYRQRRARVTTAIIRAAERHANACFEPPERLTAAEGEWSSHASSWPRTGAAGGHRPLEPGDRSSAIRPSDFLLLGRGELPVLPTVLLRIVDAAPTTQVFVNLGATMQVPRAVSLAPKIHTALHVSEVVLSAVWQRRRTAALVGVGLTRTASLLEPTALHPGREAVMKAAMSAAETPPAARWPWAHEIHAGAVVYVSDFMEEDAAELGRWLRDAEAAGARVAGVLVYSPAELAMVEGGTLASSGAWLDRAEWTTADLLIAFQRHFDRIEALFDATTGGLTVIDTTMSTEEICGCLVNHRLSEILR